ncbi:MAG: serine/threonine protein kinase [Sandaracinaceae bacterium]|nr:serine/threonine protein kinase [Sandaracinaceae bacterium]
MTRRCEWGLVGVVLLAACAEPPSVALDEWSLVTEAGEVPLTVPARVPVPDAPHEYALRRRVTLPVALAREPLELSLPYLPARARLRVDGQDAVLLEGADDTYRSRGPTRFRIPASAADDGVLDLELCVEHRWRGSGRLDVAPRLLPADRSDRATRRARVFHLHLAVAALALLAQVGLTCVAIFLVDRRRRSYFWFGIQALFGLYYPLFVAGLTSGLGPVDLPLLPTALVGATHVGLLFTHSYFSLPPPSRLWWITGAGVPAATWVAWLALDPFLIVDVIAPPTVLALGLAIGYQLVLCARLVREGRDPRGATLLAACWGAVALTAWVDFGGWLGIGEVLEGTHPATLGLALFALFLSLLLGRGHMRSLARADDLNVELSAQVETLESRRTEIERLNVELQRQLDERSSQILAALAQAGSSETQLTELAPGERLAERYRVVGPLGRGGMGSVYEVVRETDGARLALKVAQEVRGLALARLAREAQIACRVSHPNVVRVYDVDVAEPGFVFVVMELVEGPSLAELSMSQRSRGEWLEVLAQICDGLGALHAAGIVHRDLKPANVLVCDAGGGLSVKLVDFGISRMLDDPAALEEETQVEIPRGRRRAPDESMPSIVRALTSGLGEPPTPERARSSSPPLTRPGGVPGTPPYLAPELVLPDAAITPAADVFSFGVLAYQLLTGVRPYLEPAAFAVLEGREVPAPPPITDGCPGLDPALAALLEAAVGIDPRIRPSVGELAAALRAARAPTR